MILAYLYCCHSHSHNSEVACVETVAEAVHLTVSTVKKYLVSLADRGLITTERSLTLNSQSMDNKNFFTLPNEVFLLRLPPSAFMVYAYLLLIEDRRTHTCHPSYNTIATATGMAKNTVIKSIGTLLEMSLITTDYSKYIDQHGMKWNGNNLYTILPVSAAVDVFYQRQLYRLELDAERKRILKQQEEYDRRHPRAALCAPAPAPDNTLAPPQTARRCVPTERPCARGTERSRIKTWRHKRRQASHNCPQCGQFPGCGRDVTNKNKSTK